MEGIEWKGLWYYFKVFLYRWKCGKVRNKEPSKKDIVGVIQSWIYNGLRKGYGSEVA